MKTSKPITGTKENRGGCAGSPELLEDLFLYWYEAVGAPTEGSAAAIRERWNRFPKKIMVVIAGTDERYLRKIRPGIETTRVIGRCLERARKRRQEENACSD